MNRVHGKTKWERDESSFYWNIIYFIFYFKLSVEWIYTLFSCQILLCISVYKMVTIGLSGNTQFSQMFVQKLYVKCSFKIFQIYNNDKNSKITLLKPPWFNYKVDQKRLCHWLVVKKITSKKRKNWFSRMSKGQQHLEHRRVMCLQLLSSLNIGDNLHRLKYLLTAMQSFHSWNQYSFEEFI